jgi:predicted dehydrogenase
VSVYARIGTYFKDFDVDDTGVLMVNWDNDVVSYIESGWWQPHADGIEACTQLYGTKGLGRLFPTKLLLGKRTVDSGFTFPRPEHCPQMMYNAQMAYFIRCILTNRTPVPGGSEGLVNMQIVDAAYKSSLTGKVEKIVHKDS